VFQHGVCDRYIDKDLVFKKYNVLEIISNIASCFPSALLLHYRIHSSQAAAKSSAVIAETRKQEIVDFMFLFKKNCRTV